MIQLKRLKGQQITVNSDLIKFVESNPDTVITLVNGEKILVSETPDDVRARVIEFRRAVISEVLAISANPEIAATAIESTHRNQTTQTQPEGRLRG